MTNRCVAVCSEGKILVSAEEIFHKNAFRKDLNYACAVNDPAGYDPMLSATLASKRQYKRETRAFVRFAFAHLSVRRIECGCLNSFFTCSGFLNMKYHAGWQHSRPQWG